MLGFLRSSKTFFLFLCLLISEELIHLFQPLSCLYDFTSLSFFFFWVLLKVMNSVTWTVYVEVNVNPDDCQRPSISSQNSDHSPLDLTKFMSNEVWNCSWITQLVDAVVSCISNFTSAKPQWNCSFGYHFDGALVLPFRGCQRKRAAKIGCLV